VLVSGWMATRSDIELHSYLEGCGSACCSLRLRTRLAWKEGGGGECGNRRCQYVHV